MWGKNANFLGREAFGAAEMKGAAQGLRRHADEPLGTRPVSDVVAVHDRPPAGGLDLGDDLRGG